MSTPAGFIRIPNPSTATRNQSARAGYQPSFDADIPVKIRDAIRHALDDLRQTKDTLLPLGLHAEGNATVVIPIAPALPALVPGCKLTFTRAGLWQVTGVFSIQVKDTGSLGLPINGSLLVRGLQSTVKGQAVNPPPTQQALAVLVVQAQPVTHMVMQKWQVRVNAGGSAQLQVQKDAAATGSASLADGANSSIQGVWCGV